MAKKDLSSSEIFIPQSREEITLSWLNLILSTPPAPDSDPAENSKELKIDNIEWIQNKQIDCERATISKIERIKLNGDLENELNLIMKSLPENKAVANYAAEANFYHRELMVYKKLFKDIENFQDSFNLPSKLRFRHPKCYFGEEAGSGENPENYKMLLIMEDLTGKKSKFEPYFNFEKRPMDLPRALAVIKQLALFHAETVAYKFHKKFHSLLEEFPFIIDFLKSDSSFDTYIENGFGPMIKFLQEENKEGIYKGLIEKLKLIKNNAKQMLMELLPPVPGELEFVVLVDLHGNNILFSENNDKIEACIIDYQALMHGRAGTDLAYFLLQSCDLSLIFQDEYLNQILEYYQTTFEKVMEEMKTGIKYPLEKLKKDFETGLLPATTLLIINSPHFTFGPNTDQSTKERTKKALMEIYKRDTFDLWKK